MISGVGQVVVCSLLLVGCSALYAPGEGRSRDGGGDRDAAGLRDAGDRDAGLTACDGDLACPLGRCEPSGVCSAETRTCLSGRRYVGDDGAGGDCVELCRGASFGGVEPAIALDSDTVFELGGVSANELVLLGDSEMGGQPFMSVLRRASHDAVSGELETLAQMGAEDANVFLAHDGDTYYRRSGGPAGTMQRGRLAENPPVLTTLAGLESGYDLWAAPGGARVYLSRGAGPSSLVVFERDEDTEVFASLRVHGVTDVETFTLSSDELELIYATRDPDQGYELLRSTRESLSEGFADGVALAELSGPGDELAPVLSADGRVLYFQRSSDPDAPPEVLRVSRVCDE